MHQSLDSASNHGAKRQPVAEWRRQANCLGADPDLFFVTRKGSHIEARRTINEFCVPCPVRQECLEDGMKEAIGIWGGKTVMERRKLRIQAAQQRIHLIT